jgi:hypothetical protein
VVKITDSGVMSFNIESISSSRLAIVIGGSHTNRITGDKVCVVFEGATVDIIGANVGVCNIAGFLVGGTVGVGTGITIAGLFVGIYQ